MQLRLLNIDNNRNFYPLRATEGKDKQEEQTITL